jgi:hypothetical protein
MTISAKYNMKTLSRASLMCDASLSFFPPGPPLNVCTALFWRWGGGVGHCVRGSGPLWSISWSSSPEVLAESGLSVAWTLEHTVYPPCNHCGSSKTASQYFSSPVATTLPRDSLLSLSIMSCDIWFRFTRQSFLLTGSEACPLCMAVQCVLRMKKFLCLPLPYCLHKLHMYLRCEIWCVFAESRTMLLECKLCKTKQFVLQFIASDICVTLGTAVARQKSSSALCMPVYTKTNRFPSIAICVFACMNIGTAAYTIFCVHIWKCWSFKG